MFPESLLTGENAAFLDEVYRRWLADPESVEPPWRDLFSQWDPPQNGVVAEREPPLSRSSIFGRGGGGSRTTSLEPQLQAKVVQLINTYRVRGHMAAEIDPLGRRTRVEHPELTLGYYGLTDADLDKEVLPLPLYGMPERVPLSVVVERCRQVYCASIGSEFMNIPSLEEKLWVIEQLETLPMRTVLTPEEERRVLRKLCDAENFERLLHTRFPGTKRFSLEGAETVVPLLDLLIEHSGALGASEVVLGMAHRGRLNVLANILEKPVTAIVAEFEDVQTDTFQGSGDVKYHLGYSSNVVTVKGDDIHLNLAFNPSHLEAVDPVIEGRVRAKQDRAGDENHTRAVPILLHGDAAFAGQGLVAEVLNLSQLTGYRTGGTIHLIVNNQIGFTTAPAEGRSTPYCTDVARMLGIPIFHVNGEDPRAVAAVVRLAAEWRYRFHKDVVIDMYCYRKHGHNEGDEPSFTQPLMYRQIRARSTPRATYESHLVAKGSLKQEEADQIRAASQELMDSALRTRPEAAPKASDELRILHRKEHVEDISTFFKGDAETVPAGKRRMGSPMRGLWAPYKDGSIHSEVDTGFDPDALVALMERSNTVPVGFHAHAKVKRLLKQRTAMIRGERGLDWAVAEQAAFATLLTEGYRVRLSGQDSGRGTFSQRHAVLTDAQTGAEYFPLQHLVESQGVFRVIDSPLSEAAVVGFEYGYSLDYPDALVMWEAQFGDFSNGAQVLVDQFVSSGEQKWNRLSGLVLLLPHGYEGQGPEHSSARLERWLQLCAQDNLQVANCTTPANYYHLLRRQTLRKVRKPLIVMTPKSLLRHPSATSTVDDLANGAFQHVIDDPVDPANVERIVFCSGKIYYDLLTARAREGLDQRVALVRVELLYPYPKDELDAVLARYPSDAQRVWCQEEPKNMGAWPVYIQWLLEHMGAARLPRYAGRPPSASTASGSNKVHRSEQERLVADALTS